MPTSGLLGAQGAITIANSNTGSGVPTPNSFVQLPGYQLGLTLDGNASGFSVSVNGTYTASGGLIARGSVDGINWTQLAPLPFINALTGVASATIASAATGLWYVSAPGFNQVRIDAEGAVTGTANIGINEIIGSIPAAQNAWANQTTVAAATGTAIKASAGFLFKVVVVTSGSAATLIYDNASALSGTVIGAIPASPAIGSTVSCLSFAANGMYAGTTNTSSFTAFWS